MHGKASQMRAGNVDRKIAAAHENYDHVKVLDQQGDDDAVHLYQHGPARDAGSPRKAVQCVGPGTVCGRHLQSRV
jgi:hypothetical protein